MELIDMLNELELESGIKLGGNSMVFNKTIRLLLLNGNPNGIMMGEISNWNGKAYKVPRNELKIFSTREDAYNTGVYFLFGKNDESKDTIYIGEAERIYDRLKQHINDKEYWTDIVAFISKDNNLNKAHDKYLENNFYKIAKDANRNKVLNSTVPTQPTISEFDIAELNEFISHAKLLVNTLGYKVFDMIVDAKQDNNNQNDYFKIKAARGADAKGSIVTDGFAVLKNSIIANSTTPSISQSLSNLRYKLINDGVINDKFIFVKDYLFTSPSLAAAIVMGRNANGRTEWKNNLGKSIKDIDESK